MNKGRTNRTARYSRKSIIFVTLGLFLFTSSAAFIAIAGSQRADAVVSGSEWRAGQIIDDVVFYNNNDMSVQDIQTFLNNKVPTCDTNGQQIYSGTTTNAQYAAAQRAADESSGDPSRVPSIWTTPAYVCLKDYYQVPRSDQNINNLTTNVIPSGAISAANIIKNAADTYRVSPKALLVLLEKESLNLIKDNWPLPYQYRSAMGYGCSDTAPCEAQYEGFYNQITNAARQFRIYVDNPTAFRHQARQNNSVYYNPGPFNSASNSYYGRFGTTRDIEYCGSSVVYIQTLATAGLYNYTPYQPNQAALNNMYGTGDVCSAYGNRNFWRIFRDWFGSTTGPDYSGLITSTDLYSDSGYTAPINKIGSRYVIQPSQTFYARVSALNTGRANWNTQTSLGTSGPNDRSSVFYSPTWVNPQRVAKASGQPIAPYQSSTFSFELKAPATPNLHSESFNIVQDGVTWMTAGTTLDFQIATPVPAPSPYSSDRLDTNAILRAGESLISADGYSALSLSPDGVLQLRRDYQVVWSAGVSAGIDSRLIMQGDGNLVLYNKTGGVVWNSQTNGNGPSKLYVQEDGNLVIYRDAGGAIWSTGTGLGASHLTFPTTAVGNNGVLMAGQATRSVDRKYNLHLQTDGNLVLYSPTGAIWASHTDGSNAIRLAMQTDGNLVLYNAQGSPVWNSGTAGRGASSLNVQPDGNLVIYNSQSATWASNTSGRP